MDDNSVIPPDAPRPRLCHLKKWSDFNGYGFNLHAERGKAGQFVGTIDLGSPAEVAQMRAGDRIVEVNGTNIGSENHQQVVQRIKAVPNETRLLVVDAETDAYYRDRKIVIRNDMSNIEYHETPDVNPFTSRNKEINTSETNTQVTESAHESEITASVNSISVSEPDYDRYQARLCRLKIWPDFSGYGFNLHADRTKMGQFIGKVDAGSPAEESGLREGDRIMEVNGVSVVGKNHAEVVGLVKSRIGEVDMLVVDPETDEHYQSHNVTVHGAMPGVITITCPHNNPHAANHAVVQTGAEATLHETHKDQAVPSAAHSTPSPPSFSSSTSSTASSVSVSPTVVSPSAAAGGKPVTVGGIEFAGSAKEARERMTKKRDVKHTPNVTLKEKYDILQKL